ncbi:MAG: oligosaccharide flippase family protein [Flavobacteriaceae bacterium]
MLKLEKVNSILIGFLSNSLGTLVMFAITLFLTRVLDQELYGEFRLAFSFVSLMVVLLLLGRDNGVVFFSQKKKNQKEVDKIITEEAFFSLIILVVGVILLGAFKNTILQYVFNNNLSSENYLLSLFMIPLWGFFNIGIAGLKAKKLINYSFTLTNFTQRIIRATFFLVLIFISQSFFSLTLSMILSQLVLLFLLIRKLPSIILVRKVVIKNFFLRFTYSLKLGLASIIFVAMGKIDVIMLGNLRNNYSVAIYDICILLSFVVIFPYLALVKSSEPIIIDIIKSKPLQKKYKQNLDLAISIASFVVAIFVMQTEFILSFFGENYMQGKNALIILTIGYLCINFLASPLEFLNMSGYTNTSLIVLVFTLVLNTVLNYFLIPIFDLNGAAIATMISLLITKLIALFFVKKKLGLYLVDYKSILNLFPLLIILSLNFFIQSNYKDYFKSELTNTASFVSLLILFVILSILFNVNLRKIALKYLRNE